MRIYHKTFAHNYIQIALYEAGISLTGGEVKMIRAHQARLDGSYVKLLNNGPCVINMFIAPYQKVTDRAYEPRRTRQLLLHKKEILSLRTKLATHTRYTLIPIALYMKKNRFKLSIALAQGRNDMQKKKLQKSKDEIRRIETELKEYKNT